MKWIKKKKVEVNKNDKKFKIGKIYKFNAINNRNEKLLIHNDKAKCIELYETYGLFQFKNYKECFLYSDDNYIITEV
ncbi:hypothetical protein HMPREF9709_01209 [Helcococcus kunzii ATCC 51366]|uniref:Uncharacterized protein n=1 Tax=Helcococcus kunzii ATCC 51366 TaxID=883114 RepID=H3NPE8_9FIRM|nr:hypothetical protein [Helcococcus kunzii]EHR33461.1 hypothetical protein HMPREF9709_01209 [Helcococcus kunzii ATCC 51366]